MRIKSYKAQYVLYALLFLPGLLTAEGSRSTSCSEIAMDEYQSEVLNHVVGNWVRPFDYRRLSCIIVLTQNFRGEVDYVEILDCDSEISVRKSAEDAGYVSSPLPMPKNRACFSKQLSIRLLYTP
jgi:hypothetical protein